MQELSAVETEHVHGGGPVTVIYLLANLVIASLWAKFVHVGTVDEVIPNARAEAIS